MQAGKMLFSALRNPAGTFSLDFTEKNQHFNSDRHPSLTDESPMNVQAHILVTGLVQGIGYRYFVARLGCSLGLGGWVRNLPTGQVEITAEGDRSLIESMIGDLKTGHAYASVKAVAVDWGPWTGRFREFRMER
jgi:acylphosphatase